MSKFKKSLIHMSELPKSFWLIIFATLINQMGHMAIFFLIPYLTDYLHLSLSNASFAFATTCFALLISGLISGSLVERFGSAIVMIASLVATGIILLSFLLLHSFYLIVLFCLLWGFAFGLHRPASQTLVSLIVPTNNYKLTFSVYRLVLNLGMSIGPALGGYLATNSFPTIFILNASANLLAAIVLITGLINKYFPINFNRKITNKIYFHYLKQDKVLRNFLVGITLVSFVFYQHSSILGIFLHNGLGLPLSFFGLLFTINTLMIVLLELPLNILTLSWNSKLNLIFGSILMAIGFGGFSLASLRWHVVLLTMIWSVGEMLLYPAASAFIAEIAPQNIRGHYMSLYNTSMNLGLFLGPWFGSLIMTHFSSLLLWLACAIVACLSSFMFLQLGSPNLSRETINDFSDNEIKSPSLQNEG